MDLSEFRDDIDLEMMYDEIFYAVDGYMLKKYRLDRVIPDEIERELLKLIDLWKKIYTKKGA